MNNFLKKAAPKGRRASATAADTREDLDKPSAAEERREAMSPMARMAKPKKPMMGPTRR